MLVRNVAYLETRLQATRNKLSRLHREVKEENFSSLNAYTKFLHECRLEKENGIKEAESYEWMLDVVIENKTVASIENAK